MFKYGEGSLSEMVRLQSQVLGPSLAGTEGSSTWKGVWVCQGRAGG